ncbi:MAG: hypothetical protein IIX40_05025, partial [Alistipes sp.]|nr:hypothetical protein [Alistipes sp.]
MRKLYTLLTMCSLLLSGCINSGEKANINDLQLMSGISNRQLLLDGAEGSINTFSFRAKHDWQIIDYQGFTCDPSSGTKCDEKESITITTTTLQANNGADTVRLSDLNFKLLSTRFVGVSAYQLPQVIIKDCSLSIDAIEGSKGSARIVSKAEDIQLTTTGDITATLGTKNYRDEYTITIKATASNNTTENRHIGTVGFVVNGVTQGGKIEVYQVPAIVFDR